MDNHTYNKLDDILQAEYKRGYEEGYAARKEAEQKRKEEEDEIKVGDEVKYRSIINTEVCGIVTGHDKNYLYFFVLAQNGEFGTVAVDNVVKTGRTFPQIAEVFEQMK